MEQIIGWISSLILVLTVSKQVYKQYSDGESEGVSIWLFIGQIAASIGFAVYSVLIWNPVFIFTNSLLLLTAVFGLGILVYHKREQSKK